MSGDLRVATFNVHHGADENDVYDIDRLAAEIEALNADLIGLQEVDRCFGERSRNEDGLARLAEILGMEAIFSASLPEPGSDTGYGIAILGRTALLDVARVVLPVAEGLEPRSMLTCVAETAAGRVTFACTHLSYEDEASRTRQVEAVMDVLAGYTDPVVLVGDFNTTPDAPELDLVRQRFADAWDVAGEGPGRTCPAENPRSRIDYVFLSPGLVPSAAATRASDASDHRPVVVEATR